MAQHSALVAAEPPLADRVTVVIATQDRSSSLRHTLTRLGALDDPPRIVVVDDASRDGTTDVLAREFPHVEAVPLVQAEGPVARNHGVRLARTPYVAFSDDDSWWAPGALERAAEILDRHPGVGAIAARIVVEPGGRLDPICHEMAHSPLDGDPAVPGVPVLSFLAGAAVVRRAAFAAVGGFEPRLRGGGEEESFACDLAAAGWEMRFVDAVVAHHQPVGGDKSLDRMLGIRNALWFAWRRRPLRSALRWTAYMVRATPWNRRFGRAVVEALRGLPWALRTRRVIPPSVEAGLRALDHDKMTSEARRYG